MDILQPLIQPQAGETPETRRRALKMLGGIAAQGIVLIGAEAALLAQDQPETAVLVGVGGFASLVVSSLLAVRANQRNISQSR